MSKQKKMNGEKTVENKKIIGNFARQLSSFARLGRWQEKE